MKCFPIFKSPFSNRSLVSVVEEAKREFQEERLNHKEVLEKVSERLGESLKSTDQRQLRRGTVALLGKSTTVFTIYSLNESFILEHTIIKDDIEILPKIPSPIQTTSRWNDGDEELTLRVKFSAGQKHGWSSLKLASEYQIIR